MKTLNIVARLVSAFFKGWSYKRWDPPYPGDGI